MVGSSKMAKMDNAALNNITIHIMLFTAIVDMVLALMESILGNINVALIYMCVANSLNIAAQILRWDLRRD